MKVMDCMLKSKSKDDMKEYPKTILCDIDGVLFEHRGDVTKQHLANLLILDGTIEAIKDWDKKGYKIILLTGRRESVRQETEAQLTNAGIIFDHLIMGLPRGTRVVINDTKPNQTSMTAFAICVKRNEGLGRIPSI